MAYWSENVKWGQKCHGWTKCHGRTCIAKGGVKVIRAILQYHWTHLCYFGALGTKVLVLGRICGYKNKLLF
mgnify:CR=1 FL=1